MAKIWINKNPPKPFYGPDDYLPWMDVPLEELERAAETLQWLEKYGHLSVWNKIRLMLSSNGIYYDNRTTL